MTRHFYAIPDKAVDALRAAALKLVTDENGALKHGALEGETALFSPKYTEIITTSLSYLAEANDARPVVNLIEAMAQDDEGFFHELEGKLRRAGIERPFRDAYEQYFRRVAHAKSSREDAPSVRLETLDVERLSALTTKPGESGLWAAKALATRLTPPPTPKPHAIPAEVTKMHTDGTPHAPHIEAIMAGENLPGLKATPEDKAAAIVEGWAKDPRQHFRLKHLTGCDEVHVETARAKALEQISRDPEFVKRIHKIHEMTGEFNRYGTLLGPG